MGDRRDSNVIFGETNLNKQDGVAGLKAARRRPRADQHWALTSLECLVTMMPTDQVRICATHSGVERQSMLVVCVTLASATEEPRPLLDHLT